MYYIFCGAYKSLFFALYIRNQGNKITVLTYNKDIIKYCQAENINCIEFQYIRSSVFTTYKLISLKRILDKIIKEVAFNTEDAFILLGDQKTYDAFYLAKEFSKKGRVYYKIPENISTKFKKSKFKPFFIRGDPIKLVLKSYYGLDLVYFRSDEKSPCFGVDKTFFNKHNMKEYLPDIDVEEAILETVKKIKSSYKEVDNLIIDQGLVISVLKFDTIKNLYEKLFELPIKFAFKKHPKITEYKSQNEEKYYNIFKNCDEIPKYIPVEFYGNNIKKNVISLYSTSLTTLSQLPHLNAISLLELVDWYDESYKNEWRERLNSTSNGKIHFPKTFEELKEILLKS